MPSLLSQSGDSVLVVVDVQPSFLKVVSDAPKTTERCKFLVQVAQVLGVPLIATEQYPSRMGGTDPSLLDLMQGCEPIAKMCFGCAGQPEFVAKLHALGRKQVVLVGAETQICIAQTALQLIEAGYQVFLPADAIMGRGQTTKASAMRRMVAAGAIETHTESVAYEWMGSAEHDRFKTVLELVKQYPAGE